MAIHFLEQDRKIPVKARQKIKKLLSRVIVLEGKNAGLINLVFCSDEYLAEVNREFLGRDYFTDVISFGGELKGKVTGDILISCDRIVDNAKEYGVTFDEELMRVMVHGLLHLSGYDDATVEQKQVMTNLENRYLELLESHET